jgi:uncharacterized protein
MKIHALRLNPGNDLRKTLQQFVENNSIHAGWIVTGVGSLKQYNIRFANQPSGEIATGFFEIVSLTGTLSLSGVHLHLSISDESGKTIGGHLLDENLIYTTAEIVIGESPHFSFYREVDSATGYRELVIKTNS